MTAAAISQGKSKILGFNTQFTKIPVFYPALVEHYGICLVLFPVPMLCIFGRIFCVILRREILLRAVQLQVRRHARILLILTLTHICTFYTLYTLFVFFRAFVM